MANPISYRNPFDYPSILARFEYRWIPYVASRLVGRISGSFLTVLSAVWSLMIVLLAFLNIPSPVNHLIASLFIVSHYITDSLDGAIGRLHPQPLYRWGFYVDHLLDFVFMWSIFVYYHNNLPMPSRDMVLYFFVVLSAIMAHGFLIAGVIHRLPKSYFGIGLTEFQGLAIIANIVFAVRGTAQASSAFLLGSALMTVSLVIVAVATALKLHKWDRP